MASDTRRPLPSRPRTPLIDGAVVAGAFATSRIVYYVVGIRFDTSSRSYFWQYLAPEILEDAPVSSLVHLHIQPPMFNGFLWLSESVSPLGLASTTRLTFLALGLALGLLVWLFALELGLGRLTSVAVAIVASVNPAVILYENWLYTTYPVAVLAVALALVAARFLGQGGIRYLAGAAVLAASLVYLRSAFHPVWFVAVLAVLAIAARRRSISARQIAAVFAVPVLLVAGLVVKNTLLFGTPATSSWMGMSLAKMTIARLPPGEWQALVASGDLSEVSLLGPFRPFDDYPAAGVQYSSPTGIAALDVITAANGQTNFNYRGFIEVESRLRSDSLTVVARHPLLYLSAIRDAGRIYVGSPSCYPFLIENQSRIVGVDRFWRTLAYGELTYSDEPCQGFPPRSAGVGTLTLASLCAIALLLIAAVVGRTGVGRRARASPSAVFAGALFMYVTVVTSMLEIGENQRFRMEVEPLQIVLTVWIVVSCHRAWRSAQTLPAEASPAIDPELS